MPRAVGKGSAAHGERKGFRMEERYLADLHVHSTRSDGSDTPEEVLSKAKQRGLTHMVFTDHDTTEGARELALRAERDYGIRSVPGIEISAFDFRTGRKAHILGYAYQSTERIEAVCRPVLERRIENCLKQIGLLRELGYEITEEQVREIAGPRIYKQHILDALVRTGQADSIFGRVYQEVFKNGGPCDFDIEYADAEAAVRAIREDGGFAVLAHPGQQKNLELADRLAAAGLSGIEYDHPSNRAEDRREVLEACQRLGLFPTGGSDYHGRYEKNSRPLGAHSAPENALILFEEGIS